MNYNYTKRERLLKDVMKSVEKYVKMTEITDLTLWPKNI